jgi:glycosyltransferase involved in cell wall biosynthesis
MKKNILFVHLTPGIGGGTTCLYNILRTINRDKYNPILACYVEHEYISKIRSLGIEVHVLKRKFSFLGRSHILSLLLEELPFAFKLYFLILRKKIDIVHLNNDISRHIGSVIGSVMSRTPIICTMRGYWGRQRSFLIKSIMKFVSHYIIISKYVEEHELSLGSPISSHTIIYDGVDLAKFVFNEKAKDQTKKVAIVGNLHEYKGHKIFLEAAKIVGGKIKNIEFLVVGNVVDQKYFSELKDYVKDNDLEGAVIFKGFISDVPGLLNTLDIFVHASTTPEPFGMVICEAMAASLPVVSTDIGGPKEIVTDQFDGLLIEPKNADVLAQPILMLLEDPNLRKTLGENARKTVENKFTAEKTASEIEKIYERF